MKFLKSRRKPMSVMSIRMNKHKGGRIMQKKVNALTPRELRDLELQSLASALKVHESQCTKIAQRIRAILVERNKHNGT